MAYNHKIHFHRDIGLLEGNFFDRFGQSILVDKYKLFGYFLQDENIVKVAYSKKQAKSFLDNYKGQKLEPLYFYRKKN